MKKFEWLCIYVYVRWLFLVEDVKARIAGH